MAKEKKVVEVNAEDIADVQLVNEADIPAGAEIVDEVVVVEALLTGRFQEDRNVR